MQAHPDKKKPGQVMEPGRAGDSTMAAGLHEQCARIAIAGTAVNSGFAMIASRAKVALKRFLIAGYCWHLIPHWVVTAAFRNLRLEVL